MKPIRIYLKVLFVLALIVIPLLFFYPYLLDKLGCFLIYEQSPQKADLIVVLNGRDTERSLEAVDLYNQGYASLIIMASGAKQPGSEEFWRRVGSNFRGKIFFQSATEAMGVPENAIKLIGNGVTSTYDEALATKRFMSQNDYRSILLVTSKWHSRRAYLTFRSVLNRGNEIKITVVPSKYDSYNPGRWWTNEADAELIFYEYLRLVYYTITLRISPITILS